MKLLDRLSTPFRAKTPTPEYAQAIEALKDRQVEVAARLQAVKLEQQVISREHG